MSRHPTEGPTEGELEILKILWEAGAEELTRICTALRRRRPLATTTVATRLRIMREKGLVERRGAGRSARWSALLQRAEATSGLLSRLLDVVFEGSAQRLFAHLVESGRLSKADRAAVQKMLDQAERQPQRTGKGTKA